MNGGEPLLPGRITDGWLFPFSFSREAADRKTKENVIFLAMFEEAKIGLLYHMSGEALKWVQQLNFSLDLIRISEVEGVNSTLKWFRKRKIFCGFLFAL